VVPGDQGDHPAVDVGPLRPHRQRLPLRVDRRAPAWFAQRAHAAGLPPIRLYDLRHSYATAALAAGVPTKIVSERLGHASIAITLDTYSHVLPNMQEEAAEQIARLILGNGARQWTSP
jgi:integrase